MTEFRIKRAYDAASDDDGLRILVDRLWPRGLKKETVDAIWDKEAGPSNELRKEFGHVPERFEEFRTAYRAELDGHADELLSTFHEQIGDAPVVTLVYGAKDTEHNQAVVLREWLLERWG